MITCRKSLGESFLLNRCSAIERQEHTLLGFPAIYSQRIVTSWTSPTLTQLFNNNLKGPKVKKIFHYKNLSFEYYFNLTVHFLRILSGIFTTYIFIGDKHTCFPWHQEDVYLSSFNFHNGGAVKVRYT